MNNKIKANFLVIDDDHNQDRIIQTKVVDRLKEFDIDYWLVDPADFIDLEANIFEEQKFLDHIFEETKGFQINAIASDCNLIKVESLKIQGIDIISLLLSEKRKNYNKPFILYSGKIEESSKHILEKIQNQVAKSIETNQFDINSIEILRNLMSARIVFSGRNADSYSDEIVKIIKSEIGISDIIISSFHKFGKTVLNTGNSVYDGKTLDDIVQLVINQDTQSQRFLQEFIELAIAHYTSINV